jgi:PhnB protein
MANAKKAVPEGLHTVTPQLTLDNAAQAIDWYKKALGIEEISRATGPDGKIMHADLRIGDSHIFVNDPMGDAAKGPKAIGGSPASLWLYVENCDALFNRAVAAGGKTQGPMGKMADQFWGDRSGTFTDPFGYSWTIATHKEDLTPQEMQKRQDEWMKSFAAQPTH